jgi:hypothetical protein
MNNGIKLILILVGCVVLNGCGGSQGNTGATGAQGNDGAVGATGVTGPTASPSPTATESAAQVLVDEVNASRELQGQAPFTSGLACTVQAVGSGQWLSASSPGYVALTAAQQTAEGIITVLAGSKSYPYLFTGSFDQVNSGPGANSLLPTALQPLFLANNYKIGCNGQLVITQAGYYTLDMNSDDGSILTIDGVQVINNDGNHAMTDGTGVYFFTEAVHTFSLLYAQSGGGNFGLVLQSNGTVLDGSLFYH